MKKIMLLILVIGTLLFTACNSNNNQASEASDENGDKITVYTSFYTLNDLASKIGGDNANVINMIPPGGEPHHWEPTASDIMNLEKADVFIYNGLSLEHWVEDVLNAIENEDLIVLEASSGIDTLESSHSHDHDQSNYSHHEVDPHIWLDPIRSKAIMNNIKEAFIESDPENQESYEDNYIQYAEELDELNEEYKENLAELSSRDMVVSHEAFTYLSQAYDLNQVAIEGLNPDSEPNPSRMAEIIDYINVNEIKTIFYEDVNNTKIAETISKETGVDIKVLYTLEYLTDEQFSNEDDYFSVMRQNLQSLKTGLE